MANTIFVNVFRVEHGDYMYIPIEVQQQYPEKFVLQKEEEEVKVEVPVVKKRGKVK